MYVYKITPLPFDDNVFIPTTTIAFLQWQIFASHKTFFEAVVKYLDLSMPVLGFVLNLNIGQSSMYVHRFYTVHVYTLSGISEGEVRFSLYLLKD